MKKASGKKSVINITSPNANLLYTGPGTVSRAFFICHMRSSLCLPPLDQQPHFVVLEDQKMFHVS